MTRGASLNIIGMILLALYVEKGNCVSCYLCSSAQTQDCVTPNINHLKLQKCNQKALLKTKELAKNITADYEPLFDVHLSNLQIALDCLKMVIKVSTTEVIVRGCQLAEQSNMDICTRVAAKNTDQYKMKSCKRCSTDSCNSATANFVTFVILIPLVTIAFLL